MSTVEITNPEVAESIDVGGIATNYHDVGEGDPVLLIHGSGPGVSAWANWRTVLPELSKNHRVIAPDVLGFGYTEWPDGATSDMATWTEHLVGLMDALGIETAAIIGNSFGGALALNVAAHHPDRVSRLTVPDQYIRELTQPTLVIHGRDDEVIPLSNSLRLHELIEQSQLHVFGQCGHWVQIEHAEDFTQLVGNFLA